MLSCLGVPTPVGLLGSRGVGWVRAARNPVELVTQRLSRSPFFGSRNCRYIVELLRPRFIIRDPPLYQKKKNHPEPQNQGGRGCGTLEVSPTGWDSNRPHPGVPSVAGLTNPSARGSVATSARGAGRRVGPPGLAPPVLSPQGCRAWAARSSGFFSGFWK